MRDLNKQFGIVSLIFLTVMAISPAKEYFRQWRRYQRSYNDYLQTLPQRLSPVRLELKQVWNPELDVTDRCTTCHLGINEPALKDAPQPFTTHPAMYHEPERFGCTPCHQGQGLATNVTESFGFSKYWDEPIFPRPFSESSCGTCHHDVSVKGVSLLERGRELLVEYSCASCHEIKGIGKKFTPRLDGIGLKVSREWLVRWLSDPAKVSPSTRMPNFHLTTEESDLLADFLLSFTHMPEEEELMPLPAALQSDILEELSGHGETLFRQARCISCHLVNEKGGSKAPEIGTISSKASLTWIYNFIKDPQRLQPGIPMPQYNFSPKDIQAVTAYIASEFIDFDAPEPADTASHIPDPNYYEKGLALFNKYNCRGCHSLENVPISEGFGPALSNMRKKPFYQLEFGNKDIPHTKEHYIIEKLKDPRGFLENARMPSFQLSEQDILAITTALLSFQEQPYPKSYTVEENQSLQIPIAGEFGQLMKKYQCLACHRINGNGSNMAPDLSLSGSKLRPEWIRNYFNLPYTIRPILTERMPNFYMSDQEIDLLSGYISMVFRDDSLELKKNMNLDQIEVEQGRKLYYNTFGCQACHQIGDRGGYVGPPLDNLSKRLQPGWVYEKLKNPHKFDPDVLEPNLNLTDQEAEALAAFLLAEKKGT